MQRRAVSVLLGATSAVALVSVGCARSADTDAGKPTVAAANTPDKAGQLRLEEARFLDKAEGALTRRCMEAKGFQLKQPGAAEGGPDSEDRASERPLPGHMDPDGVLGEARDLEFRRVNGYGLFDELQELRRSGWSPGEPDPSSLLATDPNQAYLQTLSPIDRVRWKEALEGSTEEELELRGGGILSYGVDGCVAEARRELFTDVARWLSLTMDFQTVDMEIVNRAEVAGAYQRALRAWRQCMEDGGLDFKRPGDVYTRAYDDYMAVFDDADRFAEVRAREIKLAVADMKCQDRAKLESAYAEAVDTARKELAQDSARVLLEEMELRTAAVARAKRILTGS